MAHENRNVPYCCAGFSSVVQKRLDGVHSDVKEMLTKASQNKLPVSSLLATFVQRYAMAAESAFAAGGASLRAEAAAFFEQRGFDPEHDRKTLDIASQAWQHSTESVRADLTGMVQEFPRMRWMLPAQTVAGVAAGAVFGFVLVLFLRLTEVSVVPNMPEQATPNLVKIGWKVLYEPYAFILHAGLIAAVALLGGCVGKRRGGMQREKQICNASSAFMAKADDVILKEWQRAESGFVEIIRRTHTLEKGM